jgi:hypothetical protein
MISEYVVDRAGGKYVVKDSVTGKIVSRHLTYVVALRHCEMLTEQARRHNGASS